MDRGIPTEEVLSEMRSSDPPIYYLVGTPKGRLSKLDHRKVLWNAELMAPGRFHHANGQPIARGQYGGRTRLLLKKALGCGSTALFFGLVPFPNFHRNAGAARALQGTLGPDDG